MNSKGEKSLVAEAVFFKKPNDWTVKLFSTYNRQYTGGGDEGLIDGIRGTTNFASGEWQGYQPQDFVAVIDSAGNGIKIRRRLFAGRAFVDLDADAHRI